MLHAHLLSSDSACLSRCVKCITFVFSFVLHLWRRLGALRPPEERTTNGDAYGSGYPDDQAVDRSASESLESKSRGYTRKAHRRRVSRGQSAKGRTRKEWVGIPINGTKGGPAQSQATVCQPAGKRRQDDRASNEVPFGPSFWDASSSLHRPRRGPVSRRTNYAGWRLVS